MKNLFKESCRPRIKTIILLVGSLGTLVVLSITLISLRATSIANTRENDAGHQFAHVVSDLTQACGESGSIESLQLFFRNVEQHELLEQIRAIRSPVTIKDFDQRKEVTIPDEIEKEVLNTGETKEIVNKKAHEIRYVRANIAEESCIKRCHKSAQKGDVLGVASIIIKTDKADAETFRLNWMIISVFLGTGVIQVIFVIILFSKESAETHRIHTEESNEKLKVYVKEVEQLAEKAEAANTAKSQFLANMSHEIRTPMNAIMGFSSILAEEEITEDQKQYVDIIKDGCNNLLQIIGDILDFSKIEAGKLEIEMAACSPQEILTQTKSLVSLKASEKDLEFKINIDKDAPKTIVTDSGRLSQCLINLANNSVKFTEKGHVHINVSMEDGNEYIRFDVEDTGIGIKPEYQELIFQSFSQADYSSTRKYGGTGLGLAITKQLVTLLGGELTMKSQEGKGSTFSLLIPVKPESKEQQLSDGGTQSDQSHNSGEKIEGPEFSGEITANENTNPSQKLSC